MGRRVLSPVVKEDRKIVAEQFEKRILEKYKSKEKFYDEVCEIISQSEEISEDIKDNRERIISMLKLKGKGKDKYIQFDFTTPEAKKLSAVIEVLIGFNPYDEFYRVQGVRDDKEMLYLEFINEIQQHNTKLLNYLVLLEGLNAIKADSKEEAQFIRVVDEIYKREHDTLSDLFEEE